jgi:microcystin degradation protein MlrC
MRVAIGQLWQETNTFNPIPTTRADFEAFGVMRGGELIDRLHDTNEPGGFIQSLRGWPERPDIVGLVRLPAWPGGRATADTLAWLRREMLDALERAGSVDAVLLALHGALVAEGEPDVEGAVLDDVRGPVGPRVPIVVTLDLHANITRRMVQAADAIVLYHTAPHIDIFETGKRGAAVLRRILLDGARPVTAFQKVPAVFPAERANTQDPDSASFGLRRRLVELEQQPGILAAGLATVQPWLDIPDLGSAVVVVADGDPDRARGACAEVAAELWSRRRDYLPRLEDLAEAVRQARALCGEGLVVLGDSADSTTSGAPGDSTHVLAELLRHDWPRPALVPLVDPELVERLYSSPPGTAWSGKLGGKRDRQFGRALDFTGEVERSFEASFVLSGHLGRNLAIDMGRSVVLRAGNVRLVVTSRSGPHFAPELFRSAGFDPFAAAVLVAKSPCGFRAAYRDRARAILMVRAPGCAPSDFWHYPYHHISRPLWPWDEVDGYRPEPQVRASAAAHPGHFSPVSRS